MSVVAVVAIAVTGALRGLMLAALTIFVVKGVTQRRH